ncbi:hypothetical protein MVEG_05440 [Podila verticillata NRRL 6337]|nr:hypothetical protein MVEG_05440 [Podila verticillata NRRL 6337]
MQFFDQSRPCQWSMRLDNLYVLTYGERSYAAVPVVAGVDSVAIGFDLSLDRFAGPYKVMQPLIALLTFGANKYAETVFRMHNVMLSASTGIDLDYSLFVNQTITGPGSLTCSFKFKVDNDTSVQNTFTLGKPFFRKYYVGFHYPTSKVGIASPITPTVAPVGSRRAPTLANLLGSPLAGLQVDLTTGSLAQTVASFQRTSLFQHIVQRRRRRNNRAKLAKVHTEDAGNTTLHSEPVPVPQPASAPAPAPVPVSGPRLVPTPMALSTIIVGSEEMVLVPMNVTRSMFPRESVPLASRQAPPLVPLPLPTLTIPNDKTHHEREMQEIRQASGVELGPGGHESRVHELNALQAATAAAASTGLTGESSSISGTKAEI